MKRMGAFAAVLGLWIVGAAGAASAGDVVVTVPNVGAAKGDVLVNLYATPDALKAGKPTHTAKAKAAQGKVQVTIPNVPAGNYVVQVHHDENGNGLYDKDLKDLAPYRNNPREGFGWGNLPSAYYTNDKWLSSNGVPGWEDSVMPIPKDKHSLDLHLVY